jgi:3-methyladenine DNA glycosylase AlkD
VKERNDPVLQMRGVGKEIWANEGGDALIARERASWDSPVAVTTTLDTAKPPTPPGDILARLNSLADPSQLKGMARFGIRVETALGGISVPALRKLAREIGKDHRLAQELWSSGIHEARHLAAMVDEPARVTEAQMERWVKEFDSWDVCDGCCLNLFHKTPFAFRKAMEWSRRKEEFVKRSAFSLMAVLAVHDKKLSDRKFESLLSIIKRESNDGRNFVKKSVNWALRQIGKRNLSLNRAAIETTLEIRQLDSSSARWIAADALRELKSDAVQKRLRQ